MADLLGIFGFLVVLLRAATLCCQTILAGGVIFLSFVASNESLRPEELTRPAWKIIRLSGVGLALSQAAFLVEGNLAERQADRKSTRLNSSHTVISYAVFCLTNKDSSGTRPSWANSVRS